MIVVPGKLPVDVRVAQGAPVLKLVKEELPVPVWPSPVRIFQVSVRVLEKTLPVVTKATAPVVLVLIWLSIMLE